MVDLVWVLKKPNKSKKDVVNLLYEIIVLLSYSYMYYNVKGSVCLIRLVLLTLGDSAYNKLHYWFYYTPILLLLGFYILNYYLESDSCTIKSKKSLNRVLNLTKIIISLIVWTEFRNIIILKGNNIVEIILPYKRPLVLYEKCYNLTDYLFRTSNLGNYEYRVNTDYSIVTYFIWPSSKVDSCVLIYIRKINCFFFGVNNSKDTLVHYYIQNSTVQGKYKPCFSWVINSSSRFYNILCVFVGSIHFCSWLNTFLIIKRITYDNVMKSHK